MSGYLLVDKPNHNQKQYRETRRNRGNPWSGVIVIHTAESAPDYVGADTGAEAVADWITRRADPGSYHRLCDSDSIVRMVPWEFEAWHCIHTNNWSVGISAATKAHKWSSAPAGWREATLRNMAKAAAEYIRECAKRGVEVPLRWGTRAEALAKKPGFYRHGTTDPTRRSDPWPEGSSESVRLLELVAEELGEVSAPKPAPAPPGTSYKVVAGDTLGAIAKRYGTTVGALAALNRIPDPNKIRVGQVLRLPAKTKPAPKPTTTRVLRRGATGSGVLSLQQGANRVFPAYAKLKVDGIFGPATEAFVKEFQRRSGLAPDGIVGPLTRSELAKHGIKV